MDTDKILRCWGYNGQGQTTVPGNGALRWMDCEKDFPARPAFVSTPGTTQVEVEWSESPNTVSIILFIVQP